MSIANDEKALKGTPPHIVVGTPGRILALIRSKKLNLKHLKHFILDECDKMLEALGTSSCLSSSFTITDTCFPHRHATGRSGDFQVVAARETSDDVQRHAVERHPTSVQEVHAGRKHTFPHPPDRRPHIVSVPRSSSYL